MLHMSKRKRFIGYGLLCGLILLLLLFWWQRELIAYGWMQGKGQWRILREARPLTEILNDPQVADSLKQKILLVQEVRQFAIDSLGLKPSDSYNTLFDQQGKDVLWVLSAARPFAMESREWSFPVVGTVSYKGYFDLQVAQAEQAALDSAGWDTYLRSVGAWSTLGWFNDPIMSKLLFRGDGDLANTIIHELTHGTVFVPDSLDFNENLASFIGHEGAKRFLQQYRGELLSESRDEYLLRYRGRHLFSQHLLRGKAYLDSLYRQMPVHLPAQEKQARKQAAIRQIVNSLDTLPVENAARWKKFLALQKPNNAYFLSYQRYQGEQDTLRWMLENHFDHSLERFIAHFRKTYGR
jgi:predicted aminopeptidase